jgi:hypothetical protein
MNYLIPVYQFAVPQVDLTKARRERSLLSGLVKLLDFPYRNSKQFPNLKLALECHTPPVAVASALLPNAYS